MRSALIRPTGRTGSIGLNRLPSAREYLTL
jgi:hypothetical protein